MEKMRTLIYCVQADTMIKPNGTAPTRGISNEPSLYNEIERFRDTVQSKIKESGIRCFYDPVKVFFVGASHVYDREKAAAGTLWPVSCLTYLLSKSFQTKLGLCVVIISAQTVTPNQVYK